MKVRLLLSDNLSSICQSVRRGGHRAMAAIGLLFALGSIGWAQPVDRTMVDKSPQENSTLVDRGQSTDTPSADWAQWVAQGRKYREEGNTYRALQLLQQADAQYSNDTLRREIADCLYARGQYRECIAIGESLLYPDSLDRDLYLLARCYDKMEMPQEATHYQRLVAERNIENCNNLLSLCKTLIDGEIYDEALELLDRYCAIDSTHAGVNALKAYALHKSNRFREAVRLYEQLLADGDNRASTLYYLGLSYYRLKHIGEAYDLLQRAVERDGRLNSTLLSRFGVVELSIKRDNITWQTNHRPVADTASILREFNADCQDIVAEYNRIDTLCQTINRQGQKDIEEAIRKMYPDPEVLYFLHFSLANHYFWQSDDKTALKYFAQCLADSPEHTNIYYNMAVCHHNLKDYRNEMKYYQLFVDKAPADTDHHAVQAAKEAIQECRKVLFMTDKK